MKLVLDAENHVLPVGLIGELRALPLPCVRWCDTRRLGHDAVNLHLWLYITVARL